MINAVVTRFGFARMPFGRDLPPSRLHRHADCGEAAARITWAVAEKTIAMITGEVGTGMTVAIRSAVADLDPAGHTVIYIGNPATGVRGILAHVVTALGASPSTALPPSPSRPGPSSPASDTQGSGPPATSYARLVAAKLAAAGKLVSRRALRSAGARGSKQALHAPAREISAGLTSGADNRLSTTAPRCREGPLSAWLGRPRRR